MKLSDKVIWRKLIYQDYYTIVDPWGTSDDDKYRYKIEICIYKVFSWKNGFSYQIKAPDILINDKYEPVLLEINNRPNLSVRNQVDTKVKRNLFQSSSDSRR